MTRSQAVSNLLYTGKLFNSEKIVFYWKHMLVSMMNNIGMKNQFSLKE